MTDERLRSIQRDLGERQARLSEIDREISRALEAAAQRVVDGEVLDVALVTSLRGERAVVADQVRALIRAAELAGRAARDADARARAERFRNDPRPAQSVGGTLKPGVKALLEG